VEIKLTNIFSKFSVRNARGIILKEQVDDFVSDVSACLLISAQNSIPIKKTYSNAKPFWDCELTTLSIEQKQYRRKWICDGRPRNPDHSSSMSRVQYKQTKSKFRAAMRMTQYQYELRSMGEIAKSCTIDQKLFWYLVNRRSANKNTVVFQPTIDEATNQIIYDEIEFGGIIIEMYVTIRVHILS